MGNFIFGFITCAALMNPVATKAMLGRAIDAAHGVYVHTVNNAK